MKVEARQGDDSRSSQLCEKVEGGGAAAIWSSRQMNQRQL